jgi:hypothetical protein
VLVGNMLGGDGRSERRDESCRKHRSPGHKLLLQS